MARLGSIGLGIAFPARRSTASATETTSAAAITRFETLSEENYSARARGGARGDNKTDDTASLQSWINYLVANHKRGTLTAGTYRVSAPLVIPAGYEWAIDGDIAGGTRILQMTDNVPIFDIGPNDSKPLIHTWRITNIEFDYANDQPPSNESATPILFSQMACEFSLARLRFARGSYAIAVKPGMGGPWGGLWDELVFESGLSAGAMRWTGCVNGVPNNKWGRLFVDCHNMVGPVFKDVRGYNWVIDTIEFIAAQRGAQLFSIQAGSVCTIGAIKLENGIYRKAIDLIGIGAGAHVKLGQFYIGGNAMMLRPESGAITLFSTAIGGRTGTFELDTLSANATSLSGNVFVISGAKGSMRIDNVSFDNHPWQICDNATTQTGDTLTISQYKNDRLSDDLGDANHAIAIGDPNILSFETPFSASRTLQLPSAANQMFNGLYYEVRVYGAVSNGRTLTVACGGDEKFVIRKDRVLVRFAWRRNANASAGWILTQYEDLP